MSASYFEKMRMMTTKERFAISYRPLSREKKIKAEIFEGRKILTARAALKLSRNILALHCHPTSGPHYIDAGLADVPAQNSSPAPTS